MNAANTPDWIALARLAGIMLTLASLLGGWAWWRNALATKTPAARLAAVTALTLFVCFDLVVFGSYTRLTDSGLGCPDWPGCYGLASPHEAAAPIAAAEQQMPWGPVTERKAWIEMIHRYLAGAVGSLNIAMLVLAWRARASRPGAWKFAAVSLAWVIGQGLFGRLTVTWKLYPAIVTAHLLGGLGLLVLLVLQYRIYRADPADPDDLGDRPPAAATAPGVAATAIPWAVAAGVLAMQVALGGWVSTNYAVLACTGFPACNGQWWPALDMAAGFQILRELGHTADGGLLGNEALVAIHWTHRLFAIVALLAIGRFAWRLRQAGPAGGRWALAIGALLAMQIGSGLSNVVLGWPLPAALLHSAGAAALVAGLAAWGAQLLRQQAPGAAHIRNTPRPTATAALPSATELPARPR